MIDDRVYSKVEFRSTREPMGKNLLSTLQFKLSSLNVDRQVRDAYVRFYVLTRAMSTPSPNIVVNVSVKRFVWDIFCNILI